MEFTKEQTEQIKQLKEIKKIKELQRNCELIKTEIENLSAERSDALKKREMLISRITSLGEELQSGQTKKLKIQTELKTLNRSLEDNEDDNLQSLCLILGYQVSKCQVIENNGLQVTLSYRDTCYVTYNEIGQMFDVIQIYPSHVNFAQIKEFLQISQDLRGLLSYLRKFFDLVLEHNEKQEHK